MGLMSLREFSQSFTLVAPENAGQGFSGGFGGRAIFRDGTLILWSTVITKSASKEPQDCS